MVNRCLLENFENIVSLPLGGAWRGFFKLRVGDWRIIYEADRGNELVIIHAISPRDKVYK